MKCHRLVQSLLLLLYFSRDISAFVYSCEEVRYRLLNTNSYFTTKYACITVRREDFTNWEQLRRVYFHTIKGNFSFVATDTNGYTHDAGCYTKSDTSPEWRIVADPGVDLDCSQEFTVTFSSQMPAITVVPPENGWDHFYVKGANAINAPATGIVINKQLDCNGHGDIVLYTGSGKGSQEQCFQIRTWKEGFSMPDWIISFDSLLTLDVSGKCEVLVSGTGNLPSGISLSPGERVLIFSSGLSDDLQNLENTDHRAPFKMKNGKPYDVSVSMDLTFDNSNTGHVGLQESADGPVLNFSNGRHTEQFDSSYFEVRYVPKGKKPSEISNSNDNILIDITIGDKPIIPSTTPKSHRAVASIIPIIFILISIMM